ncbi:hypothetical protein BaRGS_00036584 [Batillaria attramentaria]|uniref:Uncharacterized protein n=1 Tax=Batillaria attramentaria TaxID=370345 RepID=A0ABD0JBF4_9CAEN
MDSSRDSGCVGVVVRGMSVTSSLGPKKCFSTVVVFYTVPRQERRAKFITLLARTKFSLTGHKHRLSRTTLSDSRAVCSADTFPQLLHQ